MVYEVEVKSLLGEREHADALLGRMKEMYPDIRLLHHEIQKNHYFMGDSDATGLVERLHTSVSSGSTALFAQTIANTAGRSLRTRETNSDGRTRTILVVKASVDDGTSTHSVRRIEAELTFDSLSLDALDAAVLESGFSYLSKWSRERDEYSFLDMHVSIDHNAGYGYLAEFERMTSNENEIDTLRDDILREMGRLGVSELPQDRLERMFAHYNAHWNEYYGTDRTFTLQ